MLSNLSAMLPSLKERANQIDAANKDKKSHKLLENGVLFSSHLFNTRSDKFLAYIYEIETNIKRLEHLLDKNTHAIALELIEKIEQQMSAIHSGFSANGVMHKEASIRQKKNAIRYKKVAKKLLTPSHELHQKLAEYHEFERRLMEMLTDKSRQASTSNKSDSLTQEILTLHQRLGRCRQAISKVEREIAFNEKKL